MTRLFFAATVFVLGFLLCFITLSIATDKIEICHLTPGASDTWTTVTIPADNWVWHEEHGDYPMSCSEACEVKCDDGNVCTVDACADNAVANASNKTVTTPGDTVPAGAVSVDANASNTTDTAPGETVDDGAVNVAVAVFNVTVTSPDPSV